ncbi:MAG: metallophosphoesterase [Candidatus Neomarinimicrobiota bacterium]
MITWPTITTRFYMPLPVAKRRRKDEDGVDTITNGWYIEKKEIMSSKTFGIISDVHGNIAALKTAISILEERDNIDQLLWLGDYFSLGPAPREVLDVMLKYKDSIILRGNHERYLKERIWEHEAPTIEGMSPDDPVCQGIVQHQQWTYEQIGKEGIDFIDEMRISHRDSFETFLLEFTHAWYERDEQPPSLAEAITWRNHVKQQYPAIKQFLFIHGHIHIPRAEENGNIKVLCPVSTGLPFDGLTKGAVAFLTLGSELQWEVHRFDYDLDATLDLLEERKPPFYRNLQNTVRYAEIRNEFV